MSFTSASWETVSVAGSTSGRSNLPEGVNVKKAKIRKKKNNDHSWEDEMLMYDVDQRDAERKKARREKDEMSQEMKELKKLKETEQLYQREERKLFLGGLSMDTVEKDLRKHFGEYGTLVDCQVMRDRESGKSRGFGFVTFSSSFMAEAALEKEKHVINEKEVSIRKAVSEFSRYKETLPELEARNLDESCRNKRSIFVGALKGTIGEEDLVQYFSGFGKVLRAIKVADPMTGDKKTFGFVDFAEYGVVRKIMNVTKHFIHGKRIRVELSRPRIEFSHQTKTVFVGGLEDGIGDTELMKYFSEFGFVSRAVRIPDRENDAYRKFGFVDFDDYDPVDIVVGQRDHFIGGHRVRVELALPLVHDSLYEKDIIEQNETWMEKVKRKLQYAVPDQGVWGETMNNYEVFVQGGNVKTLQFKIPRPLLEDVVGMGGKVVDEIANDTNTRINLEKPKLGAKFCVFTVTGKQSDVQMAQLIFQKIYKSNQKKLQTVKPITDSKLPPIPANHRDFGLK